jgi:ABC-2 type transport system permease protein
MAEGVVFDLGYRPHEGERLGRSGARRALYKDGLRRVLGLRRKMRRKVFPVVLIAAAVLPALFFVALGVIAGEFDQTVEFFGHPQYFDLTGSMALVFIALASGELLIPDRVYGTLQVYASRPLTTVDYLIGRAAALATVVVGFLWLPHLVLFLGRAWVSSQGFGSYVTSEAGVLATTFAASVVYFLAFAPLAFAVSSVSKRAALAAGVFLGVVTISGPTSAALVDAGFPSLGLFSLQHHPGYVKDWIMGSSTHSWIPERAGYEPILSLVVILTVAVASWLVVLFRQRRTT